MKIGNTIGRFFAEEWQAALNNTGDFYTPAPTADMSIDQLTAIQTTLSNLVAYWQNQVISNTNSDAIANSQAIVDLEQSKLNTVNSIIDLKTAGGEQATQTTDATTADTGTSTGGKDYTMLLLIGAGIGALWLFNKKKKKKKVTGQQQTKFILPMLIGGGLVYLWANKKYGEATQTPEVTMTTAGQLQLGSGGTVYTEDIKQIYSDTLTPV